MTTIIHPEPPSKIERTKAGRRYDVVIFSGCPDVAVPAEYVQEGFDPLPYPNPYNAITYEDVSIRTVDDWAVLEVNPWQGVLREMTFNHVEFREDDGIWVTGFEVSKTGLMYVASWQLTDVSTPEEAAEVARIFRAMT